MSDARELKERALAIDPVIDWERPDAEEIGNGRSEDASDPVRLSEWVEEIGWGRTLASFPAARKFMSELAEGEAKP